MLNYKIMRKKFIRLILNRLNHRKIRKLKLFIEEKFSLILISSIIGVILLFLFSFVYFSRDLPTPTKIKRAEGFSTVIYDRNGKQVYDIFKDKNIIPISFSDIPDSLKKATIAIEDKDFYKHEGFDPKGILRAFLRIISFRGIQGGSTLTQQLVKNVLLTTEKTIPRKIKEFVLAIQIERKYTKDEILQMYLNEAPYGGTYWGVESAARGYFGKSTKDLNLIESVILAGIPQLPSVYNPFSSNPQAYISRSKEVLRRMKEDGYITDLKEKELTDELNKIKFSENRGDFFASHFVFFIKKQLIEKFGENRVNNKGLKVFTTLDSDLQLKAEKILKDEINKLKKLNVTNGAALVTNPTTGEILTYIGSKEYSSEDKNFEGKFDIVSLAKRQPGSALKPIAYAVSFSKGYTPASILMDVETKFPGGENKKEYQPKNYDGKFRGPVQLRFALANSINIPAVKLTALIGVKDLLQKAYDMGLTTLEPSNENVTKFGLSLVLGGGEVKLYDLVTAYGVFANNGIKNELYSIEKVTDFQDNLLYEHKKITGKEVLDPEIAFLINDILSDNNARKEVFGTNSYLYIPGRNVAVKTGTTDDKRDNWTVGYSTNRVVGVWVGNNDNSPMNQSLASGVSGAAPIWNMIIKEAISKEKNSPFAKPDQVIQIDIDSFSGGRPYNDKPTRKEYFIEGTQPENISPIYQKLKISKNDSNKLANNYEIATGNYEEKEFIIFEEEDPTSKNQNYWQEGINNWISKQDNNQYKVPTETSQNNNDDIALMIKNPIDNEIIDNNNFKIYAEARSNSSITKIELYINDNLKKIVNDKNFDEDISLENGIYTLKIKAYSANGKNAEKSIKVGIKENPNPPTSVVYTITPTVTP